MKRIEGDKPIEADVYSAHSLGSNIIRERKMKSALWSCQQLKPCMPSNGKSVKNLFDTGMGTKAPLSMRVSVSASKLNLNGSQAQFNRQRDSSYQDGRSVKSALNHGDDSLEHRNSQFLTEKARKKMISVVTIPP